MVLSAQALVIGRLQLGPLCRHERRHHFLNKLLTLGLRLNGVQKECVLDEELPQILAILEIIFVCGIPFAEMLGDRFSDSLLHDSAATSARPIGKEDVAKNC